MSDKIYYAIAALLAVTVSLVMFFSTNWGIGISPDSYQYINIAKAIYNLDWPLHASLHFPPLYSAVLAAAHGLNNDIYISTRWVQISILFLSIVTFAYILRKEGGSNGAWLLMGLLLFFLSPGVFQVYMMAWSEPLFLLLALGSIYLLARYIETQRLNYLLLSSIVAALALMTRYVGLAIVATAITGLLLNRQMRFNEKVKYAFIYTIVSLGPLLIWVAYESVRLGSGSPREFTIHVIPIAKIVNGFETFKTWFHLNTPIGWGLFIVFIVGWLYLFSYHKNRNTLEKKDRGVLRSLLWIFVFIYLIFLLLSISFFDAHTPLDHRILIPAYMAIVLAIVLDLSHFSWRLADVSYSHIITIGLFLVACILAVFNYEILRDNVKYFINNGIGSLSKEWVQSETLKYVREEIINSRPIYSNGPEIIDIHLGRKATMLPRKINALTKLPDPDYAVNLEKFRNTLANNDGVVVYFSSYMYRNYLSSLTDLDKVVDMEIIHQDNYGMVLQARK